MEVQVFIFDYVKKRDLTLAATIRPQDSANLPLAASLRSLAVDYKRPSVIPVTLFTSCCQYLITVASTNTTYQNTWVRSA